MAILNWQSKSDVPFPTVRMPSIADLKMAQSADGVSTGLDKLGAIFDEYGAKKDKANLSEVMRRAGALGSADKIQAALSDGSLFGGLSVRDPEAHSGIQNLIGDMVDRQGKQQTQEIKGYEHGRTQNTDAALDGMSMAGLLDAAGRGDFKGLTQSINQGLGGGAPHEATKALIDMFGGTTNQAASDQNTKYSNSISAGNLTQRRLEHSDRVNQAQLERSDKLGLVNLENEAMGAAARISLLPPDEQAAVLSGLSLQNPRLHSTILKIQDTNRKLSASGSKEDGANPSVNKLLNNPTDKLLQDVLASKSVIKLNASLDSNTDKSSFKPELSGSPHPVYLAEMGKMLNMPDDPKARHATAVLATKINQDLGGNVPPEMLADALYKSAVHTKKGNVVGNTIDGAANILANVIGGVDASEAFTSYGIDFDVSKAKNILEKKLGGVSSSETMRRQSLAARDQENDALLSGYDKVLTNFQNVSQGLISGQVPNTPENRALLQALGNTVEQTRNKLKANVEFIKQATKKKEPKK